MQDRYVGDIGDYLKFSFLHAIAKNRKLGIAWYKYPNETHNQDGKHIGYLGNPNVWRSIDPRIFDELKSIVDRGDRRLKAVESSEIFVNASFASETIGL